jgi:hypothetical protein
LEFLCAEVKPSAEERVRWLRRARNAAVSSDAVQDLLRARGFVGVVGERGWRLMVR